MPVPRVDEDDVAIAPYAAKHAGQRCERCGSLAGSSREHEQRIGFGAKRIRRQHRDRDGNLLAGWLRAIFRNLDAGTAGGAGELRQAAIGEFDVPYRTRVCTRDERAGDQRCKARTAQENPPHVAEAVHHAWMVADRAMVRRVAARYIAAWFDAPGGHVGSLFLYCGFTLASA